LGAPVAGPPAAGADDALVDPADEAPDALDADDAIPGIRIAPVTEHDTASAATAVQTAHHRQPARQPFAAELIILILLFRKTTQAT
jgi:hypothetical protein